MTRDSAFRPEHAYHRPRETMTRIPPQIGSGSFEYSGISVAAERSLQSPSSIEKERRSVISQATVAWFGCTIVDFSGAEAYRDGTKVSLTALEWKVLRYFIDNPGRVISRHELLNKVWGYSAYPTTRTVDNLILKLRQKLELDTKNPSHFVTVHGIGYKFLHEEFESGALTRFQSLQPSIRRNPGREGECDGADLQNMILGYLSVVYELLTGNSPQGSMPPEGAKQSVVPKGPAPLSAC
jgi:DNA-binding winged helix-turn-helix (wHTH) protein